MVEDGVCCSDCKQKLDELLASQRPYVCPECGGTKQTINSSIIEEIKYMILYVDKQKVVDIQVSRNCVGIVLLDGK